MADGKWVAGLTPGMPVAEAAAVVLTARLAVVREYLPLAVGKFHEDPEYVHQLRVGTRRAGAALRAFADCLPRKPLEATRKALRSLRRAAGDARDWDVFLLGLPGAKSLAASAGKPALDFLAGYALGERTAAQVRLVEAAAVGPRFTELCETLPGEAQTPQGEDAPATLGALAARQIGERLGAFTAAVDANPTDPTDLHQLRILGKRLRYALEIFAACFPPEFKHAVYPAIEHVQEVLGDIQDAVVGLARLTDLRDRVRSAVPGSWSRLRKGFEGLMQSLRSKIPAGRKAFGKWRTEWAGLVERLKLDAAITTITT